MVLVAVVELGRVEVLEVAEVVRVGVKYPFVREDSTRPVAPKSARDDSEAREVAAAEEDPSADPPSASLASAAKGSCKLVRIGDPAVLPPIRVAVLPLGSVSVLPALVLAE